MAWTPAETTLCAVIVRGGRLRIKCGACAHEDTWSDQDLVDRCITGIDAKVSDLNGRLICRERNCGKKLAHVTALGGRTTIAWRNPSSMAHEMPQILMDREAELREWARAAKQARAGSYANARKRP